MGQGRWPARDNALVWRDRRTLETCARRRTAGHENRVDARTGPLRGRPFSATKRAWIRDGVAGVRLRAEARDLPFGTVGTWIVSKRTGARVHVADTTNAVQPKLYDIRKGRWRGTICDPPGFPPAMLLDVRDGRGHADGAIHRPDRCRGRDHRRMTPEEGRDH